LIDRYDPNEIDPLNNAFQGPSLSHFFGTDNFGRDVYSRVINGARLSMYVGLMATALSVITGATLGLIGAYFKGWADLLIQRWMDIMFIFPDLVLAMVIVTVFQGGSLLDILGFGSTLWGNMNAIVIAIAIPRIPGTARVVRSVALSVMGTQYMEAAQAVGARPMRQIFRHLTPNCMAPFIVYSTAQIGGAILVESSLRFLGIGGSPEAASWGRMLSVEGMRYFEVHPYLAIFPGIAISAAVFGVNLFGDALRDVLDPRLRGSER
ncbi:MAG: ABC transporter permease, partial [Chloroflexi bacterium]|nr:ABC transporter permease [Chloroflexota bacterium]